MPRPRFVPTEEQRRQVKLLATVGVRQSVIAQMVSVRSEKTLRRHFRQELGLGGAEAISKLAQTLFRMGISGKCVAATIFSLKTRAGWRERERPEDQDTPVTPRLVIEIEKPRPFLVDKQKESPVRIDPEQELSSVAEEVEKCLDEKKCA